MIEQEINRANLIYNTGSRKKKTTFDLQKLKTIRSFEREIYSGLSTPNDAFEE